MSPLPPDTKLLEIEGNWQIVAADFIGENSLIGVAFVKTEPNREFGTGVVPLTLGAYLAHSENPNCLLQTNTNIYYLWAVKDIHIHHSLTIDYRLYYL